MALCGILLSLIILSIQDTDEGINNYLTNTSGFIYYHTNTTLINGKPYTLLLDTYLTEVFKSAGPCHPIRQLQLRHY